MKRLGDCIKSKFHSLQSVCFERWLYKIWAHSQQAVLVKLGKLLSSHALNESAYQLGLNLEAYSFLLHSTPVNSFLNKCHFHMNIHFWFSLERNFALSHSPLLNKMTGNPSSKIDLDCCCDFLNVCIQSFFPFFYKNLKNSTYFELLHNTLTNKCTTKKIEHEEGTVEINWNNFGIN